MRNLRFLLILTLLVTGCSSITRYSKLDAPWKPIQRVGVFPFATPFDDQVHRQWATQLFVAEMRRLERFEVVELPTPSPTPSGPGYTVAAKKAGVDAFVEGSVEDMPEIFADVKITDAATGETLWSTRYHRGIGPEFSFRFNTPQQQLQRIFRITLRDLNRISRS